MSAMVEAAISVIIPSAERRRSDNLDLLLRDLEVQTIRPREVHVIKGVSPSGRARNIGARRALGDVLVFLDDDVRLGHKGVLESIVSLLRDPGIGMVGAAQLLPPGSSTFQRAAACQIPRCCSPVVAVITDSDMVTTACCAMRRTLFWELGGFNERIPRGVDPELRYRTRGRGLRIVVAPSAWFYHPMPTTPRELCLMFFRRGQQSAEALRRVPHAALENPNGHVAIFVSRRSTSYRVARHIGRLVLGLLMLRWVGIAAQVSYLAGYLWHFVQVYRAKVLPIGERG